MRLTNHRPSTSTNSLRWLPEHLDPNATGFVQIPPYDDEATLRLCRVPVRQGIPDAPPDCRTHTRRDVDGWRDFQHDRRQEAPVSVGHITRHYDYQRHRLSSVRSTSLILSIMLAMTSCLRNTDGRLAADKAIDGGLVAIDGFLRRRKRDLQGHRFPEEVGDVEHECLPRILMDEAELRNRRQMPVRRSPPLPARPWRRD
jgi:hypothetical protein